MARLLDSVLSLVERKRIRASTQASDSGPLGWEQPSMRGCIKPCKCSLMGCHWPLDCRRIGSVAIGACWYGQPMKFDRTKMLEALRRVVQRMHYPLEVMLVCVRWYAAYPLSFRQIEEMMVERGVFVDHSTLHRWSIKMLPVLAAMFRRRKRPVGRS